MAMTVALMSSGAGCRSCANDPGSAGRDAAGAQPAMPPGMLMPAGEGGERSEQGKPAGEGSGGDAAGLRVARHVKSGAWTELQVAAAGDTADKKDFQHWREDSVFVSLEAMTLLHESFARALPGFDLFLPRLFGPDALAKLATELDGFAKTSSGPIAETARELSALAKDTAAKRQSLWILGP